ncbi:MAG: FMN-binding protein [Aeromicrobium erythreum]
MAPRTTSPLTKTVLAAGAGTALLLTAACGGSEEASTSTPAPSQQSQDSGDSGSASGSYKAGDYTAKGSYSRPSGTSSVEVEVKLEADGTISDVTVTPEANGTSLQYQQKFVSGIKAEVVGKKIDDLDVSKVSGSSLTSQGFNQAIDEIKGDAAA